MDVNKIIAQNVKKLREKRKLTLDAASEITGVSRSMLAQIESFLRHCFTQRHCSVTQHACAD